MDIEEKTSSSTFGFVLTENCNFFSRVVSSGNCAAERETKEINAYLPIGFPEIKHSTFCKTFLRECLVLARAVVRSFWGFVAAHD